MRLLICSISFTSICSSFIYRTQDTPRYHLGHGIVIGFLCAAFLASALAIIIYHRLNTAREAQCAREGIHVNMRTEFSGLGSKSPLFRSVAPSLVSIVADLGSSRPDIHFEVHDFPRPKCCGGH